MRSPLKRYFLYRYWYQLTPRELAYLCSAIDAVSAIEGCIVEVGCARGQTTVFVNRHMQARGIEKPYVAIDTFSGFTTADIDIERRERGKAQEDYSGYRLNSQYWFDETMRVNGISRVRSIRADAVNFDFTQLAPIALCFIDVDLYRPVRAALRGAYDLLSAGGMLVIHDCVAGGPFDGALQACQEFVAGRSLECRIVVDKLGVIAKS